MAPKKHIEIRHRSTLKSGPRVYYTKFVTEIVFYTKEILDEDKSVCFIHLYPSIVQINRAKKLSDEPLKLTPSIFYRGVHRTVQSNSSSRLQAPLSVSFFIQTKGYICFIAAL